MFPELPLNGYFPGYRPASAAASEHLSSRALYQTIPSNPCMGPLDVVQPGDRLASESSSNKSRGFRDKDASSRSPENRKARAEARSHYGTTYQPLTNRSPGLSTNKLDLDDKTRPRFSYSETLDRTPREKKHVQEQKKHQTNSLQFWRSHYAANQPNGKSNPGELTRKDNSRKSNVNGRNIDDFDFPFPGSLGRPIRIREPPHQQQESIERLKCLNKSVDRFSDLLVIQGNELRGSQTERIFPKEGNNPPTQKHNRNTTRVDQRDKQKPRYEVIALKTESPGYKRRERNTRRPHSAPSIEAENLDPSTRKCGHRPRKPAPLPYGYKNRQIPGSKVASNVCEVENNNTIILKVEPLKQGATEDKSNTEKPNGADPTTRLRCASVPVEQNRVVVPRSAISLPCMPTGDGIKDGFGTSFPVISGLLSSPPSTRPSSLTTSSSSSNLTSECSGWVSSGDTSSSENQALKLSGQELRQKLSKIAGKVKNDVADIPERKENQIEHSYEEVRLPPPKMFQDEPPPPEEFQDPPAPIDNPIYHVYETVKSVSGNQKQCKTAPCSPQRNRISRDRDNPYGTQDVCFDCYQEGKEVLQSTQDHIVNFNKCKEEFKQQMGFSGKIYRYDDITYSLISSFSFANVFIRLCNFTLSFSRSFGLIDRV